MSTTQEGGDMSGSGVESQSAQVTRSDIANKIDWNALFDDNTPIDRTKLARTLAFESEHVTSEDEGNRIVASAFDQGILRHTGSGFRPASTTSSQDPVTGEEEIASNVDTDNSSVHPVLEDLRESADDSTEYVESMESVLSEVLHRMDELEDRQDDVEEADDAREQRVNKIFDDYREMRPAVTELQVSRLQDGEILSAGNVDIDALEDMGFDPVRIGENNDMVRLPIENQDDEDAGGATDLPDFANLCELEELRVKKLCGITTREQIEAQEKGKDKFRALAVFADAGLLDVSDQADTVSITSSKVGEKIQQVAPDGEISADSIYQVRSRVMKRMTPETDENWTDGVFRWDDSEKENKIVASADDLRDVKVQRFRNMQLDLEGGDSNAVVRT